MGKKAIIELQVGIVRAWAIVSIALVTAAVADVASEFCENRGWLGGLARDHAQQGVLPALLFGIAATVALALYVALRRTVGGSSGRLDLPNRAQRLIDSGAALVASAAVVSCIEGYETAFGAPSPFSGQSVLIAHAPFVLFAFILTAGTVQKILDALVRVAVDAGDAASHAIATYLRKVIGSGASTIRLAYLLTSPLILQPAVAVAACGLRAPPL